MADALLKFNMERDLEEILKLITEYMRMTYIQEVEEEMLSCATRSGGEMPKEAQLLCALIPFVPEESRTQLTEIADLFKYEQIIRQIMPKILPQDESRSTDEITLKNIVTRVLLYKIIKEMAPRY